MSRLVLNSLVIMFPDSIVFVSYVGKGFAPFESSLFPLIWEFSNLWYVVLMFLLASSFGFGPVPHIGHILLLRIVVALEKFLSQVFLIIELGLILGFLFWTVILLNFLWLRITLMGWIQLVHKINIFKTPYFIQLSINNLLNLSWNLIQNGLLNLLMWMSHLHVQHLYFPLNRFHIVLKFDYMFWEGHDGCVVVLCLLFRLGWLVLGGLDLLLLLLLVLAGELVVFGSGLDMVVGELLGLGLLHFGDWLLLLELLLFLDPMFWLSLTTTKPSLLPIIIRVLLSLLLTVLYLLPLNKSFVWPTVILLLFMRLYRLSRKELFLL